MHVQQNTAVAPAPSKWEISEASYDLLCCKSVYAPSISYFKLSELHEYPIPMLWAWEWEYELTEAVIPVKGSIQISWYSYAIPGATIKYLHIA